MAITSMYDILISIVGTPQDDLQALMLYMGAVCLSVLFFYFVIYFFKLIASLTSIRRGDYNNMTLTTDLANITEVVTTITTIFSSIMELFLQPPLVIFLALGIFGSVAMIVKRLLNRK